MDKVFYTKQQLENNEGSEIKFCDKQSLWKVPVRTVNQVFSRLADHY